MKVSDQNICDFNGDLNPSSQNLNVNGDALHNGTISIEIDEL